MGQMEDEWAELLAWEKRLGKSEAELYQMPMPERNKHRARLRWSPGWRPFSFGERCY